MPSDDSWRKTCEEIKTSIICNCWPSPNRLGEHVTNRLLIRRRSSSITSRPRCRYDCIWRKDLKNLDSACSLVSHSKISSSSISPLEYTGYLYAIYGMGTIRASRNTSHWLLVKGLTKVVWSYSSSAIVIEGIRFFAW